MPEHRLRRERKRRLVEHIGLGRGRGERPPVVRDGGEFRERAPLDAKDLVDRSVNVSAPRAAR